MRFVSVARCMCLCVVFVMYCMMLSGVSVCVFLCVIMCACALMCFCGLFAVYRVVLYVVLVFLLCLCVVV